MSSISACRSGWPCSRSTASSRRSQASSRIRPCARARSGITSSRQHLEQLGAVVDAVAHVVQRLGQVVQVVAVDRRHERLADQGAQLQGERVAALLELGDAGSTRSPSSGKRSSASASRLAASTRLRQTPVSGSKKRREREASIRSESDSRRPARVLRQIVTGRQPAGLPSCARRCLASRSDVGGIDLKNGRLALPALAALVGAAIGVPGVGAAQQILFASNAGHVNGIGASRAPTRGDALPARQGAAASAAP